MSESPQIEEKIKNLDSSEIAQRKKYIYIYIYIYILKQYTWNYFLRSKDAFPDISLSEGYYSLN